MMNEMIKELRITGTSLAFLFIAVLVLDGREVLEFLGYNPMGYYDPVGQAPAQLDHTNSDQTLSPAGINPTNAPTETKP